MVAIMRPGPVRRRRNSGPAIINHVVETDGRAYRVCFNEYGRVLMVLLKHKRRESALKPGGRRFRALVRMAAKELDRELRMAAV